MSTSVGDLIRSRALKPRDLAVGLAGGRIAIGVVSLVAPRWVARAMIGPDGSRGAMPLFAGMVGARDLGLGLGLVLALQRRGSVREWLEASALVDSLDVAAALLAREHLRTGAAPGVAVLAASGALLSAWLSRQLDEASPATAAVHAASEGPRTLVVERHAPGGRAGTSA